MNYALLVLLFAIAAIALCTRKSPSAMRSLSAWLRATADAEDYREKMFQQRRTLYRVEMGLAAHDEEIGS